MWVVSPVAFAATGEEVYNAKCNICHDSGAGHAPRLNALADWADREKRGRNAMMVSAIKGMPDSAMVAKGGFSELSDAEVRAAVDYMLKRVGFRDHLAVRQVTPPPASTVAARTTGARVDDATLVNRVAEMLKKTLAPDARIELYDGEATVRGLNIRVGARDGVVTLAGALQKSEFIARAQAIAAAVGGVRGVESRLIAAGMLEFD